MNERRFLDLCEEYGITVTTGNGEVTMNGKPIDIEHAVSDAFHAHDEQPPQEGEWSVERLTYRDADGKAWAKLAVSASAEEEMKFGRKSLDCLAAYEDTSLSPADIADLHNELCLKCGKYKTAHEGACDSCRWKKGE